MIIEMYVIVGVIDYKMFLDNSFWNIGKILRKMKILLDFG